MKTTHKINFSSSSDLSMLNDNSIHLVCTSCPYPMIEMWDTSFANQNPDIKEALDKEEAEKAFELMHLILDDVWKELYRVVVPGGIVCINIGDATRTLEKNFQLFNNHTRLASAMNKVGFQSLPEILWRKQTNAPNKFMGSGMLPPGAYVTLEHEFILIFRKGEKRVFSNVETEKRRESAYFWEERNIWFSDVWEFKGVKQKMPVNTSRGRSGAFPFELAYRLINMFSIKGDTILDPFLGTGTTMIAAIASERNSIGIEIDETLRESIRSNILSSVDYINSIIENRIKFHNDFIIERRFLKDVSKYTNIHYGFNVITKQEVFLKFNMLKDLKSSDGISYLAEYESILN